MKREKKLLINTVILGFGSILPKIVTFLILPLLTSVLTKTEYGTYDLISTGISFVLPIITLQIQQAVFRFLLDSNEIQEQRKLVSNSTIYIIGASILLFILGLIVLNKYDSTLKYLICIYAILNMVYQYILQICRGFGFLKQYSWTSIINSILNVALICLTVGILNMGLLGLMISLVVSILMAILYAMYKVKYFHLISFETYEFACIKKLLKYSAPLLPNSISWWVVGVSDRWIIAATLGIEMNAVYAIAYKIPSLFNLAFNNFNLAWQESATDATDDKDMTEYYNNVFRNLYDFLIGIILLLVAISPVIFRIFINKAYSAAYSQMSILFMGMFFSSLASYYGGIYIAVKQTKRVGVSALLGALINIVINLSLINRIGLYAASISTTVSYLAIAIYRAIDIQKFAQIRYQYNRIVITLGALILVCIINYVNDFYLNIVNFVFSVILATVLNRELIKRILRSLIRKGFR